MIWNTKYRIQIMTWNLWTLSFLTLNYNLVPSKSSSSSTRRQRSSSNREQPKYSLSVSNSQYPSFNQDNFFCIFLFLYASLPILNCSIKPIFGKYRCPHGTLGTPRLLNTLVFCFVIWTFMKVTESSFFASLW